jgi:trk system potassium uptake protein TrkA
MKTMKFAVIGMGQFGKAIAKNIADKGYEVLTIDSDIHVMEKLSNEFTYTLIIDATDKELLESENIQNYDAVVVAIGESFEKRLLCCSALLDLKVKRLITRANGEAQRVILQKIGVTEILSPEEEFGRIVATRMINPVYSNYIDLPDEHVVADIKCPRKCVSDNLESLRLRDRFKISLLAIKEETTKGEDSMTGKGVVEQHLLKIPDSKQPLLETDNLIIFGKAEDISRFIDVNS